jgi:hypothetical protein
MNVVFFFTKKMIFSLRISSVGHNQEPTSGSLLNGRPFRPIASIHFRGEVTHQNSAAMSAIINNDRRNGKRRDGNRSEGVIHSEGAAVAILWGITKSK